MLSHLECGHCQTPHDAGRLQSTCTKCSGPLLARYEIGPDLPGLDTVLTRRPGQFRFYEMLPLHSGESTAGLGEGGTPLLQTLPLGRRVWVKDEAQNPTGSFKARGMAVSIPRNMELGADRFCLPSNGNAGGAAAAYGALHGGHVDVAVPANTPQTLIDEAVAFGADVTLVEGTIADAASLQKDKAVAEGWFSLATLGEPYRVEGKKMMGYEIFWDLGHLPDVIIYPTGGGTGLVGMVKAFDEMEQLGWIGSERPRMVAAQVAGCAPIVRAFHDGATHAGIWADPEETAAFGLRVPSALGDRMMLEGLRRTGGTAVAVDEETMLDATKRLASTTGILGSPEVGVCVGAFDQLTGSHWIDADEEVVIFNTGAASKY